MMSAETPRLEIRDRVAVVTLNRPDAANALRAAVDAQARQADARFDDLPAPGRFVRRKA